MNIVKTNKYNIINEENAVDASNKNFRQTETDLTQISNAMHGRLRFGAGTDRVLTDGDRGENIAGGVQIFTSGAADAENTVAHGLSTTPLGFIVLYQDLAGILYQGPETGTNWDATNIYLKCDTGSVTYCIFIII